MKLPELAIRNRRFTLVIMLLLVSVGILSLMTMPRSEDPHFQFPSSIIRVVYPGTGSLDMEKLIVDPIEEAINELDNIKNLKSNIEDGLAVITVEFLIGTDPKEQYDDVVAEVARIRPNLPDDIPVLAIDRISPIEVSIMQIALMSDTASYDTLRLQGEKLEKRIERIPGIKKATTEAFPEQQLQVFADMARMQELGIGLEDLIGAIQASGINLPGGHVLSGKRRFTVRTSGDFKDIEQVRRTAVVSSPGKVVFVEDIADVQFGDGLPSYQARHDGTRAIFVSVVQREGSNIFTLKDALDGLLAELEGELPNDISIGIAHDQSESVDDRINQFFGSLLQGMVLVGIITVLFLGLRSALVIIAAVPLSVFVALGWLDLTGLALQQISIAGMIIALGLLVDNAIVVTENVHRFLRQGQASTHAAVAGSSQVSRAIVSGTLTTILSFLPIMLLQTPAGIFLRSMPVMVMLALLASLLIALTLSPLMASILLKNHASRPTRLMRILHQFTKGTYKRLLSSSLKHPWMTLSIATLALAGSVILAGQLGVSMFPKAEKPMLLVNVELPEGASFQQTDSAVKEVEAILNRYPEVRSVTSNIGKDNPLIYYNLFPKRQVPNYAQIMVRTHTGRLAVIEPFVDELRTEFSRISGARVSVKELLQGPPYEAPIEIRVMGDDLEKVLVASREVENIFLATPGTVNVDNPIANPRVELNLVINREKAAMYGVSINRIDQVIRASLAGIPVSQYRDHTGEEYPVVVRGMTTEHEPALEDFEHMMVKSASGALIPLKQLAKLEMIDALPRFQHHMTERTARVTADLAAGYQAEEVTNNIRAKLDDYAWPEGVSYQVGGEQEQRLESFAGMTKVLIMALLGIFAVLVLLFNSFIQPLIIFAAIPFAVTGMILALWLAGYTFSFTAFVGLTSLVGIVVNNSIILVDYINQLREQGTAINEAILEAGQTRLLPIILTTMTTIGGLLPLTLSKSVLWSPAGSTIIGGLLVSTLLTLFVVPVLYSLMGKQRS